MTVFAVILLVLVGVAWMVIVGTTFMMLAEDLGYPMAVAVYLVAGFLSVGAALLAARVF